MVLHFLRPGSWTIRPVSYFGIRQRKLCVSVESVTDICMPVRLMLSRAIGFLDMKVNMQNRKFPVVIQQKFPVVTQQREKWFGDL